MRVVSRRRGAVDADTRADFGHHNYDIKGNAEKGHEKGKYHTEFQST